MSDTRSRNQPIEDRLVEASVGERVGLLAPWFLLVLVVFGAAAISVDYWGQSEEKRDDALQVLAANIPDDQALGVLKGQVATLKAAIPATAFQPSQTCRTETVKGEQGETHDREVCDEVPSSATLALGAINDSIEDLQTRSATARQTLHNIRLSMHDTVGVAYAADETDFPTARDKTIVMYTLLVAMLLITFGCFVLLLKTNNAARTKGLISLIKVLVGCFTGIFAAFFGVRLLR